MTNDQHARAATSRPATSSAREWTTEYQRGGIPSSVREEPSGSVVKFVEFARAAGVLAGSAIDVGCGSGRNSLYLASLGYNVTAIDFVPTAIEDLLAKAKGFGLGVDARCHNVRDAWPCPPASQQLAIDAFCFKHQIELTDVFAYARNAADALATGAFLMISFAGREDGYYSKFPTDYQDGLGQIIRDPGNGILSRLYAPDEAVRLFDSFDLIEKITKHMSNEMHGARYSRETHIVYLRRSSR